MGSMGAVPTRRSLLIRCKDPEDHKSWEEFYEMYRHMIKGLAMAAGLREVDAQDVLQETMIKVVDQMPRFDYDPQIGSFKKWLCTIASSKIVDRLRKLGREQKRQAPKSDTGTRTSLLNRIPDPGSVNFGALWEQEWKDGIYQAALARLKAEIPAKQYQIFDCYVRKQWPAKTVAEFAGVPVSHVHMAKFRVGKQLADQVRRLEARHA